MDPKPDQKLPGWAVSPAKYLAPATPAIMNGDRDKVVGMEKMEDLIQKRGDEISPPKKSCEVR